jgi:transglutaminase-like putative cysteine protease
VSRRLHVVHATTFRYDGVAHASYNEARLTPMTLPTQTTIQSRIDVSPAAVLLRYHDYWGTQVSAFDLEEPHDELVVTAESIVETARAVDPPVTSARWSDLADPSTSDRYAELLMATRRTEVDDDLVAEVARAVHAKAPHDAAITATAWLHERVAYVPGATGVQTNAREAWQRKQGVCQDLAHLSVGLLRRLGIPARYVSGYVHPDADAEVDVDVVGQSHAWVEWWVGEWYAHDPTANTSVGEQHVVVGRGRDYDDVTPLKGVYQGSPAKTLAVDVRIRYLG